jgi:hypothetical protein
VRDHWREAMYYRSSRAARAAWQRTNQQLAIGGLEGGDDECRVVTLEPASSLSLPLGGGLNTGAEPSHGPSRGTDDSPALVAPVLADASAPSTSTAPDRTTHPGSGRGR